MSPAVTAELPADGPTRPAQSDQSGLSDFHDHGVAPWLLALLLAALTLLAYWPTFSNGFINYDDPGYVTQNSRVASGLTAENLKWAFRATIMANWHPLTWISHMADVQLFAFHPAGHHASSLFLHIVNAILLFYFLGSATGFLWRSFVVAALFALHPFNVECVAWISERKTLLCTFFMLLALFAYGWYSRKPGVARYLAVAALFALGLMAKPMIITLPFALLLLDYWPLNRLPELEGAQDRSKFFRRLATLALEKVPLLLLVAGSAYVTVLAQGRGHAIAANQLLPLSVRIPNAIWAYFLYVAKGLWPIHLTIFYPHPENHLGWWKPLLATLFLVAFTWFCIAQRKTRYLIVGWLWYLGCLVPVIGFVQVGRQAMADRYAYTPLLGIFVIVAWWIADHFDESRRRSEVFAGSVAMFLIFFGALTWRQTGYWKDNFALFNHAIKLTGSNFIAENNLGEAYMQIGRPDLAYEHFLSTTQIKPGFGLGHYNLGIVLVERKEYPAALEEFQTAVRFGQDNAEIASAYHNIGIVMLDNNQQADAVRAFTQALELVPTKQTSLLARGLAQFQLNNFAAAEADFVAGANLAPNAGAAFWVGRAREARGNPVGAADAYRQALQLQPDMTEAKERLQALTSGQVAPFVKLQN